MNLFRSALVAISVALTVSLGSASATTTPSLPQNLANSRTLDLRDVGSQIVVETIEDAIRQGGVALFDERFQLDSSLSWVFGETIEGEIDAVVPLWGKGRHAVFVQPGAVFWTGLEEAERIDGNVGVVYRSIMTDDVIGGASLFYDHDFEIGHQRIGVGVDVQRGGFHGAFNYYHPISDTQDGREGYVEDALRGMDVSLAIGSEVTRVGGNAGYWKFQGEDDVEDEWEFSFGLDAGLRIVPGVFLEGSLQRHDKDVSLGQRASVGLAFRFSLPDLKGKSYGDGGRVLSLYKPVHREKRILYEEREATSPIQLRSTDENGVELTSHPEEGDTVTVVGALEALPVAVMLELVIDEDASSAELGDDFNYGHRVYVLDEATGQQSPPGTATDCPEATCEMMIPAGVTRFDVEIEILSDTVEKEIPEEIVLQVNVPEEHQRMIRDGETTVTIQAHGNTVEFAETTSTLNENGGTVDVAVNADLASPVPIRLDVSATSTNAVEGADGDYTISARSLAIPGNANGEIASASLRLTGINNDRGEGNKTITLTIPDQSLPVGWALGAQTTHTVTLQDDDLSIFFVTGQGNTPSRVEEPASDQPVTITVGITQAPRADIIVRVAAGGTGETAQAGDYTFTATDLTFPADSVDSQTATLMVLHDTDFEDDETIVLTLTEVGGSLTAEPSGFSLGGNHTITIPANDIRTVGFVTSSSSHGEDASDFPVIRIRPGFSQDITVDVEVSGDGTATVDEDYTISSTTVILRGTIGFASSRALSMSLIDDDIDEPTETIIFEISEPSGGFPAGVVLDPNATRHVYSILDNDVPANTIGFSPANRTTANEGNRPDDVAPVFIFLEIADGLPSAADVNIAVAVSGVSDTSGYILHTHDNQLGPMPISGGAVTIGAGNTSLELLLAIPEDGNTTDETVTLTLTKGANFPSGWELGSPSSPATWMIRVSDND